MNKTHLFFDFSNNDTGSKELTSTIQLPEPVYDVKFIELADYSPPAVFFVFSCDIAESYSNDEERPIISFRLSGTGETELIPVDQSKNNVMELTIHMFHIDNATIMSVRKQIARAHIILHSNGLKTVPFPEMKVKYFMLKVSSKEETNKVHTVVLKLPEPIFNAKFIKVINWFSSGGTDYVTSPMIESTFCNDKLVKEPIAAFGVGGVSKRHEPMPLVTETLNEVELSIQRVGGAKFHRNHSFIQFAIWASPL